MSGILKLGGTTLGTENNGTIDLEFHSTSQDFTLKAVDAPIVGANYSTEDNLTSGQLAIYNGTTKLWGINESGWVQNPNVPAFLAQAVESDTTYSNQLVPYPTPLLNNGSHYNSSNSIFTAPIDGIYCFSWSSWKAFAGTGRTYIQINGGYYTGYATTTNAIHNRTSENDNTDYASSTVIISLSSGDYVNIYDGPNSTGTRIFYANYFMGYLIG